MASLTPARQSAQRAREVYQHYLTAVAAATALAGLPPGPTMTTGPGSSSMSVPERMNIGARYEQLNAAAAGGTVRGPAAAAASAAAHGADALRRQAIEILTQARAAVDAAGDIAADALAKATEQAPAARRFTESTIRPAAAVATGHAALDMGGMVPGIGEVADLTNAGWYLSEGHTLDAGISMAGTIPLGGMAAVAGRRLMKGSLEAVDDQAGTALRHLDDGGLTAHELDPVGHTISRHVGQTADDLRARINSSPRLNAVSTFASLADAERYTYAALAAHGSEIATWTYRSEPGALRRCPMDTVSSRASLTRRDQSGCIQGWTRDSAEDADGGIPPPGLGAHSELLDLIAQDLSTADIEVALAHYSCAYYPPGDGYTLDGWLRELERRLQVALGG